MEREEFMNNDQNVLETGELCSRCGQEPKFLDGLCEYCYEEEVTKEFPDDEEKEVMPKHGQGLLKNPELQQTRSLKKVLKVSRKR
jgi:predicted amidophosphoribosyltransferase